MLGSMTGGRPRRHRQRGRRRRHHRQHLCVDPRARKSPSTPCSGWRRRRKTPPQAARHRLPAAALQGSVAQADAEVDVWIGTDEFPHVARIVDRLPSAATVCWPSRKTASRMRRRRPALSTTPRHWAYMKVAEGATTRSGSVSSRPSVATSAAAAFDPGGGGRVAWRRRASRSWSWWRRTSRITAETSTDAVPWGSCCERLPRWTASSGSVSCTLSDVPGRQHHRGHRHRG